ncbi:hypothetical protein R6G71_00160 [Actinobaculum suis]|nr:hypothetical protein [Actinobaculum suis]
MTSSQPQDYPYTNNSVPPVHQENPGNQTPPPPPAGAPGGGPAPYPGYGYQQPSNAFAGSAGVYFKWVRDKATLKNNWPMLGVAVCAGLAIISLFLPLAKAWRFTINFFTDELMALGFLFLIFTLPVLILAGLTFRTGSRGVRIAAIAFAFVTFFFEFVIMVIFVTEDLHELRIVGHGIGAYLLLLASLCGLVFAGLSIPFRPQRRAVPLLPQQWQAATPAASPAWQYPQGTTPPTQPAPAPTQQYGAPGAYGSPTSYAQPGQQQAPQTGPANPASQAQGGPVPPANPASSTGSAS